MKKIIYLFGVIAVSLLTVTLWRCEGTENPTEQYPANSPNANFMAVNFIIKNNVINSFKINNNKEEFDFSLLKSKLAETKAEYKNIKASFTDEDLNKTKDMGVQIGDYYLNFSLESGFIAECINENAQKVSITVTKTNVYPPLFNFNIASWNTPGENNICVGIYNDGSNPNCWTECSPTLDEINNEIKKELISEGIYEGLVWLWDTVIEPIVNDLIDLGVL